MIARLRTSWDEYGQLFKANLEDHHIRDPEGKLLKDLMRTFAYGSGREIARALKYQMMEETKQTE